MPWPCPRALPLSSDSQQAEISKSRYTGCSQTVITITITVQQCSPASAEDESAHYLIPQLVHSKARNEASAAPRHGLPTTCGYLDRYARSGRKMFTHRSFGFRGGSSDSNRRRVLMSE
nr:hypothetical protein CFP56_52252 [Quercus suber]